MNRFEGGRFVFVIGHVNSLTVDVTTEHDSWVYGETKDGEHVWVNLANVLYARDAG